MLNVHWDPVACAAALGWDCVRIEMALTELIRDPDGCLRFESNLRGSLRRLATHVDPEAFTNEWLARVTKV